MPVISFPTEILFNCATLMRMQTHCFCRACKSLAKMCRLFLGTSHLDLEGWQMYFVGDVFPPGITNIFKHLYLCQFLMDSNVL